MMQVETGILHILFLERWAPIKIGAFAFLLLIYRSIDLIDTSMQVAQWPFCDFEQIAHCPFSYVTFKGDYFAILFFM